MIPHHRITCNLQSKSVVIVICNPSKSHMPILLDWTIAQCTLASFPFDYIPIFTQPHTPRPFYLSPYTFALKSLVFANTSFNPIPWRIPANTNPQFIPTISISRLEQRNLIAPLSLNILIRLLPNKLRNHRSQQHSRRKTNRAGRLMRRIRNSECPSLLPRITRFNAHLTQ